MNRIASRPLLSVRALFTRNVGSTFPFGHKGVSVWYNARAAIWQGVQCLGLQEGDRVLVPAYACGSELDALLKAGLALDYYRVLPDLTPDLEHAAALCQEPARAFYMIHYFGFPQPLERILAFTRKYDLFLLEDNAHGLYSTDEKGRPLGSFGDMAVFSFAKTLPVPDGGALVLKSEKIVKALTSDVKNPYLLAIAGKFLYLMEKTLAHRYPRAMGTVRWLLFDSLGLWLKAKVYGQPPSPGEDDHANGEMYLHELKVDRANWNISSMSKFLCNTAPHDAIRDSRKRNYTALQAKFKGGERVVPLLRRLPPGCCPLFFPVRAKEAEALHSFLAAHRVQSIRFWPFLHKAAPMERFSFEMELKREVLALPVHQDLTEEDMGYLAALLDRWNTMQSA